MERAIRPILNYKHFISFLTAFCMTMHITSNGSFSSITYLSHGGLCLPKEGMFSCCTKCRKQDEHQKGMAKTRILWHWSKMFSRFILLFRCRIALTLGCFAEDFIHYGYGIHCSFLGASMFVWLSQRNREMDARQSECSGSILPNMFVCSQFLHYAQSKYQHYKPIRLLTFFYCNVNLQNT